MRVIAAFLIILSPLGLFSPSASTPEWQNDFNKARQEAMLNGKMILLNFSGSDWCGPCIRMKKEIFDSEAFIKFATDHLVLVNADFPRNKKNQLGAEQIERNNALADRFNKDGKFPFTLLLNSRGEIVRQWEGLPDESPEMFVTEMLKTIHAGT